MYLSSHPDATPGEVKTALLVAATKGRISHPNMRPHTPNNLLFCGFS